MKRRTLCIILYTISTLIFGFFLYKSISGGSEQSLIPITDKAYIFSYADSIEFDGTSSASLDLKERSKVTYSYTLRKGVEYPYTGMGLTPAAESDLFDFSKYDYLDIIIDSTNVNVFIFSMDINVRGYTNYQKWSSLAKLQKTILVEPGKKVYRISLDSLTTPEWWYDENNEVRGSFPYEITRARVKNVGIINHVNNKFDTPYFMTLSSFKLVETGESIVVVASIYGAALLLITLLMLYNPTFKAKNLTYKKVTMTNYRDEEYERLVAFVGDNYTNPELSISMVSTNTGLSKAQIPELLQEKHEMMFKQYLNDIRVTEAKRLLVETDRQVTEIAISVGYNYPSSFNRIFKQVTGTSPKLYRDEHSG